MKNETWTLQMTDDYSFSFRSKATSSILRNMKVSWQQTAGSLERLSSGLRINNASDDPAGIQVAAQLRSDSRIYTAALKNINSGISALSIAEASLNQMTTIAVRHAELANQAANTTLTLNQRLALNDEANALVEEYNRILDNTKFNGNKLLSDVNESLSFLFGKNTSIDLVSYAKVEDLLRQTGSGTFTAGVSLASGSYPHGIALADFDGDGILDIVSADPGSPPTNNTLSIFLGKGDGTFQSQVCVTAGKGARDPIAADFNGDNNIDIVTANQSGDISILLGRGDGTFDPQTCVASYSARETLAVGYFNNDEYLDIAAASADPGRDKIAVHFGNGDGTFSDAISVTMGDGGSIHNGAGDLNNDGFDDLVVMNDDSTVGVILSNGDGTFASQVCYTIGNSSAFDIKDINRDGYSDIITHDPIDNTFVLLTNNGDGTFSVGNCQSAGTGSSGAFLVEDFNGDGLFDLLVAGSSNRLFIGHGDGTFSQGASFEATESPYAAAGDLNNDGAIDYAGCMSDVDKVGVVLGNAMKTGAIPYYDLLSYDSAVAAINQADAELARVTGELGRIGAFSKRFEFAARYVAIIKVDYEAGADKIMNADAAEETANFLRGSILSNIGTALLAQTGKLQASVLQLLDPFADE